MAGHYAGNGGVAALTNGNYVVSSSSWRSDDRDSGRGAVTWCEGSTGRAGPVTLENSLTGSQSLDAVGYGGVAALQDGNYAVSSPGWNNGMGAVTWGNGITGLTGSVSAANSLTGTLRGDRIGNGNTFGFVDGPPGICRSIIPLAGGSYLVNSPDWNNARGAVTRVGNAASRVGTVTGLNSLTGDREGDAIGQGVTVSGEHLVLGISAVGSGNFVVNSPDWNTGRGAVTWISGTADPAGVVSAANSLVGSRGDDRIGSSVPAVLTNGNYVISSAFFDPQISGIRWAASWGSGKAGVAGVVGTANSLTGSATAFWSYGTSPVRALSDGNYLVPIAVAEAGNSVPATGAVTAGDGAAGSRGTISLNNSSPYPAMNSSGEIVRVTSHSYDPVHQRVIVSYYPDTRITLLDLRPGIAVTGNATIIPHEDATPEIRDHTDFGSAAVGTGNGVERKFAIGNTGVLQLNLMGNPVVRISGVHAADFGVTGQPDSAVAGSAYQAVQVVFRPKELGLRQAVLTIGYRNAAGMESGYAFAIQGNGLTPLESWRQSSFGGAPGPTGDLQDYDGDGVVNLLEFAFGTRPDRGSSGPGSLTYQEASPDGGSRLVPGVPAILTASGMSYGVFLRRLDRSAAGLHYAAQFSGGLGQWQESTVTPEVVAVEGNWEVVRVPLPVTSQAHFFRVRISLVAPAP